MGVLGADPPTGISNFRGLSGPFKSIDNLRCSGSYRVCCKRDHLVANNVMQQKGSFTIEGQRSMSQQAVEVAKASKSILLHYVRYIYCYGPSGHQQQGTSLPTEPPDIHCVRVASGIKPLSQQQ